MEDVATLLISHLPSFFEGPLERVARGCKGHEALAHRTSRPSLHLENEGFHWVLSKALLLLLFCHPDPEGHRGGWTPGVQLA